MSNEQHEMHEDLEYCTADEVAECLGYHAHLTEAQGSALYKKLWRFHLDAKNPTPQGGDGSTGTVETPYERLDLGNDDKAGHWWHRLEDYEQRAIVLALQEL